MVQVKSRYSGKRPHSFTSSRRADGTHPDWYFHANPKLKSKGLWIGFNPSNKAVEMDLLLNVYFTGLTDQVRILPREIRVIVLFIRWTDIIESKSQSIYLPMERNGF